ncbi:SGNH/GDSL hydrolase family protein [Limnoglobus roseus]|uniref:SGNH hydrolase-type esterase domain-containing protein n=1 Tax=Limnoglobus roseus TaxID=2598579 RepID=A0A5C1AUF1_9BACT|nr:SGNH/GDSL hydrolase family protein [Limnoglobus roseus]QEL20864.1 hypothetical protein PX52LOC_07984 [Limnoglobus roseus]
MKSLLGYACTCVAAITIASPASADHVYLALGDSSAYGETNRTLDPSNGDRGYVAPFADYLATQNGGVRPTVLNLAINGETSASFFAGTGRVSSDGQGFNTNYVGRPDPFPQYQELLSRNAGFVANGDQVTTVTVQFGANNLDGAASNPAFLLLTPQQQQAAIQGILAQFQADYVNILGTVRSLYPTADVYAIGYHNPYNGDLSLPISALADPAVQGLNQVIAGVGAAFGAKYVDFYSAIHPNEASLTLIGTYATDPVNYVHLNDQGYAAASQALIATATPDPVSVPAPPALVLGVVGFVALAGRRVRVSRKTSCPA